MSVLITNFEKGKFNKIWRDMADLGYRIREPEYFDEAIIILEQTMKKVKRNIIIIRERLLELGFIFEEKYPESMPIFRDPADNVSIVLDEIESLVGVIPLSLRYFYTIVGTVNFMGYHPNWPNYYSDPLVVHSPDIALEWWKWNYANEPENSTEIIVAPDQFHKAGHSGTGTYTMKVPNLSFDGILEGESHNVSFIHYLQMCFKWGGFPGFEQIGLAPLEDIKTLARDLLPI